MRPTTFLRYARRESRGNRGRLAFFAASLAVGVAAVVAVAGLARGLEEGIRREARQLIAADLVVESRRPLPDAVTERLDAVSGAETASVTELVTVVAAPAPAGSTLPGKSQLVELKAVSAGYPFYGVLRLHPDRPLVELLSPETAVVAPDLLPRLGLAVGDSLSIGGKPFRIAGTVLAEPDHVQIGLTLGPRVFLSQAGLAATGLEQKGSRVQHRLLVRLPQSLSAGAISSLAERLREELPPYVRVETYRQAQPGLRRGIRRVDHFLGLVALLSLLVGGVGVAQTVRAWLAGRLEAIAIVRCLGMTPREIVALYLGQAVALGVVGSLGGILVGAAVLAVAPHLLPGLVPAALLSPWQPIAFLRGFALGTGTAALFSAPALAAVWRVPPARVLRRDAEPLRGNRIVEGLTVAALALGVYAMASLQSGSAWDGLRFTAGVAGAATALAAAAWALTRLAARLPRGVPSLPLRHGIAALARPGAATLGAIVALGLGVLVVLAMSLVERRLADELSAEVPSDAPSAFLVDIQPDQWAGVRELLTRMGGHGIESVPVVMARLAAVDGQDAEQLARGLPRGGRRWALTREQRLTYMATLPRDNRIVAGSLWRDPAADEVSLEEDFAHDLGVGLGSTLRLDIQGVPVDLRVTSLRRVDWGTFDINFFLVVEPGVLESAPQQRLATVRLPAGVAGRVQDQLAARYPNITFLRVREILEKIIGILDRIGLAVRLLGGFTVLAGVAILVGSVAATSARRGREVALLKTLGVTRRGVVALFSVEHALVGLVSGVIGAVGGGVLAWAVLTRGMDLGWTLHPAPFLVAVAAATLLAAGAGVAASSRALARRPIEVLRDE